jgi:cytochrome c peroxidase
MNSKHVIVLCCIGLFIFACKKSEDISHGVDSFLGFQKPANFPEPAYNFADNKITKEGFILGRTLFNEPRLSRNNTITCGSCHIQSSAFTQHGHDVSHGIDDRLGIRNSPPIMNLAWSKAFNWGGGVNDLDLQPIIPITTHEEMDENLENVYAKLRAMPKYRQLFKDAFGTEEINTTRFMKALSQFMLLCISSNAKYDKAMRKEGNQSFTSDEQEGYTLFKQKCASCHAEPLFTDGSFRNNGLKISAVNDKGLYAATLIETDKYKFKVPSLRNLKYTAPYMHDGRFLSLNAVLEHYHNEVVSSPTLDPLLSGSKLGIALSATDKQRIMAFLNTLNDEDFIMNPLLAEQ